MMINYKFISLKIMKHHYKIILFTLCLVSMAGLAQNTNKDFQTTIHLLDYISKDYQAAVQNGKVIDAGEFFEMQEFNDKVFTLIKNSNLQNEAKNPILSSLKDLTLLIKNKASHQEVAVVAGLIRHEIITSTGIKTAPLVWANIENGKNLYVKNCTSCHGVNGGGDGRLAAGLKPAPTNFLNDTLMQEISPFQAYNTIKLGVEGTAMQSFSSFSDKEAWDLAFYIKSLRFEGKFVDQANMQKVFKQVVKKVNLEKVATLSDMELLKHLKLDSSNADLFLTSLRTISPEVTERKNTLDIAKNHLRNALQNYISGKYSIARENALAAYLEGIEPSEARLKANAPTFTASLEQQMFKIRQVIEQNADKSEVEEEINKGITMIGQAEEMMQDKKLSYWLAFVLSASIMLREGLEAFLILALVLSLIRSSGIKKALVWVHGGWITAILLGIGGWFFSDWVIAISGKNREIMEGTISLVAVIVLSVVGFWLHDQSHTKKWKIFIEDRIGKQLKSEKMFGLAFFSFMVVFREVFESILFLQAISLDTQLGSQSSIGLGVLAAFGLIVLFAFLFLKYSRKIPIRQLFRYSAWVIILLALILMGKGIHSLQEAGWLSITGFPFSITIDWLGIFPTIETIVAQLSLLILMSILYYLSNRKSQMDSNINK